MEKSIKWEGNQFIEEESNKREKKEKKRKEKKRAKEKKWKEKEGDKEIGVPTVGNRRSDGRNLADQEVKSVYSMMSTLLEVDILPTLVYFPP